MAWLVYATVRARRRLRPRRPQFRGAAFYLLEDHGLTELSVLRVDPVIGRPFAATDATRTQPVSP